MPTSMMVRVPRKMVDVIKEYQKSEELSSFGLALEYYIRQAMDERVEAELSKIRANQERLADAVIRAHKKSNILAISLQAIFEQLGGKKKVVLGEIRKIDKLTSVELRK